MRSINNTSVCVVGGAGFLGSHLVDHLINDRGCRVVVIDNLVAGRREFINPKARFVHHDITGSEDYLAQVLCHYNIRYLFNYAAYPYVPDGFNRPLHISNVNFFGAMKVINAAHTAGCRGILQVSSAEIYGEGQVWGTSKQGTDQLRLNETAPITPHSTYGASKAAVDFYVQARWREAKVPCIALRQFNCVGERETHPYVVPEIISQLSRRCKGDTTGAAGIPIVKLGNNSSRDFLYAGDAVRMAVSLLEKGVMGEVYNLGSESSIKVYDLAKEIGHLMGFSSVQVEEDKARVRPWEIWHLQSDNAKIYQVIDTRPQLSLAGALRRTIKWFQDNGGKWPWEAEAKGHGTSEVSERTFTVNDMVETKR